MLAAHALFVLASVHLLRPAAILILAAPVTAVLVARRPRVSIARLPGWLLAAFATLVVLLIVLALYPPIAFDETLYHLPFVRAFASEGGLRATPELRFAVFPVLHELLCVPAYFAAGDVGTHFVALLEMMITAGILIEWGGRTERRAGWLAAALFLSSPLVLHLGTVLHVEMALTLFVTAGFYALDRRRYAMAGLFLGSACSVKYLGFYFAAFALLIMLCGETSRRLRCTSLYAATCGAAALPMTAWIFLNTGHPLFPFFDADSWAPTGAIPITLAERATRLARVLWDVSFARSRVGLQPPVTPLLIALVALIVIAAWRDRRARWLVALSVGYLIAFTFLPQDARYLVPLLPLVSLAAACVFSMRWPQLARAVAVISIAMAIAYLGYRFQRFGPLPPTEAAREAWSSEHIPGYRALRLAGRARVYSCGGEQLRSFAAGELLGDHWGPHAYARVIGAARDTSSIAARLQPMRAAYFLVLKRACGAPLATGGMDLVYEDAGAQLWRVE